MTSTFTTTPSKTPPYPKHPPLTPTTPPLSTTTTQNKRSSTCAPTTDLSGSWSLLATPFFYLEYERYLTALGISYFTRKIALQFINRTSETIKQSPDGGSELRIMGSNPKGVWDRTLIATDGVAVVGESWEHGRFGTTTADGEE